MERIHVLKARRAGIAGAVFGTLITIGSQILAVLVDRLGDSLIAYLVEACWFGLSLPAAIVFHLLGWDWYGPQLHSISVELIAMVFINAVLSGILSGLVVLCYGRLARGRSP